MVDLAIRTLYRQDALPAEGDSLAGAIIDPAGDFAYFGSSGDLLKLDLDTFEFVDSLSL